VLNTGMKTLVIMPGGFHPFHAGHMALYRSALEAFPGADVYVAATNDTSARPFPFEIKEKLARLAGVEPGHFVQVKSPFQAREITANYDPADTTLIFVRSTKDQNKPPQPGGVKKDGTASYLQPLGNKTEPMNRHAYMAYLPTVEFADGMTSATEIRERWPEMTPEDKANIVHEMYPRTQSNVKLTDTVVKMLDAAIQPGGVTEATLVNDPERGVEIRPDGGLGSYTPDTLKKTVEQHIIRALEHLKNGDFDKVDYMLYQWGVLQSKVDALRKYADFMQQQGRRPIARGREIDIGEDYVEETWSNKYKKSINCSNPRGFSQKAHCAARRKRAAGGRTKSKPVR